MTVATSAPVSADEITTPLAGMAEAPEVAMRPMAKPKIVARRRLRMSVPFSRYHPPDVRTLTNLTCLFDEQIPLTPRSTLTIDHCVMVNTRQSLSDDVREC
jgi:hypothetical protein